MGFQPTSRWLALAALSGLLLLAGCGQFFPPLTTGGGGSTASGDYFYVGSLESGAPAVAGFSISSSGVAAISGSPWSTTIDPDSLAITPNNDYVYIGGGSGEALSIDSVGAGGALSTASTSDIGPIAVQIDSTGSWFIGLDAITGDLYSWSIGSGGTLTQPYSTDTIGLASCDPDADLSGLPAGLVISSGDYVYASCGTEGIYALSLNSTTGALSVLQHYAPLNSGGADSGLAIATTSSGSYLIAAETVTSGVRVFTIDTSTGGLSQVGSPVSTGAGPAAVLVDSTGSYVYVANRTANTISEFTIGAGGTLSAITTLSLTGCTLPTALAEDNSHTWIASACYESNAVDTFTIGSTGALTAYKNFTVSAPFSLVATP